MTQQRAAACLQELSQTNLGRGNTWNGHLHTLTTGESIDSLPPSHLLPILSSALASSSRTVDQVQGEKCPKNRTTNLKVSGMESSCYVSFT